jgi:hypothetical protein
LLPAPELGVYEIVAQLGSGCIGEVNRAPETKLGREAAKAGAEAATKIEAAK